MQPHEILARKIVNAKDNDDTLKHLQYAFYTCPVDDEQSRIAIKNAISDRSIRVTADTIYLHEKG